MFLIVFKLVLSAVYGLRAGAAPGPNTFPSAGAVAAGCAAEPWQPRDVPFPARDSRDCPGALRAVRGARAPPGGSPALCSARRGSSHCTGLAVPGIADPVLRPGAVSAHLKDQYLVVPRKQIQSFQNEKFL